MNQRNKDRERLKNQGLLDEKLNKLLTSKKSKTPHIMTKHLDPKSISAVMEKLEKIAVKLKKPKKGSISHHLRDIVTIAQIAILTKMGHVKYNAVGKVEWDGLGRSTEWIARQVLLTERAYRRRKRDYNDKGNEVIKDVRTVNVAFQSGLLQFIFDVNWTDKKMKLIELKQDELYKL